MRNHLINIGFIVGLFALIDSEYSTKESIMSDEYVFLDGMGYKVINVNNNDVTHLKKLIKDPISYNYVKANFDKYCILSIKNNSSRDVYFSSVDSCIIVNDFTIEGKYAGRHLKGDSIYYEGKESVVRHKWKTLKGEKKYLLRKDTTLKLYLPCLTEGINAIAVKVDHSIFSNGKQVEYRSVRIFLSKVGKSSLSLTKVVPLEHYVYK